MRNPFVRNIIQFLIIYLNEFLFKLNIHENMFPFMLFKRNHKMYIFIYVSEL